MNNIVEKNINIEDMIYEIRGKQVMLDSDLAFLYKVETKRINEAVKNNPLKFPERFSFKITKDEYKEISRSNFSTLKKDGRGHNLKYVPRVFTEQGIAMLSTILKSKVATLTSINIMDAFVTMRKYINSSLVKQKYINNLVLEDHELIRQNSNDIKLLQQSFSKFEEKKKVNEIYFDGQIYDAYSKIKDIFKEAKNELIIIDSYADKTTLDMIKELSVNIILITKEKSLLSKLDIEKYNKQYDNLTIIYNNSFHDRYFILDKKTVYHCGSSINHAGSRTFSINLIEDTFVKNSIFNYVDKIKNRHSSLHKRNS